MLYSAFVYYFVPAFSIPVVGPAFSGHYFHTYCSSLVLLFPVLHFQSTRVFILGIRRCVLLVTQLLATFKINIQSMRWIWSA